MQKNEEDFKKECGKRLEELIKKNKKTKLGVATRVGVSQGTLTNWIQGKQEPAWSYLVKFSEELNMTPINFITYIFGIDDCDLSRFKVLDAMSGAYKELFGVGLKADPNNKQILKCVRYSPVMQSRIYPRTNEMAALSPLLFDEPHARTDIYYIVKGNIHYKSHDIKGYEEAEKYYSVDTSVYDFICEGNSIEKLKEAYEDERYEMGLIGKLSAEAFYLLNFVLGYFETVTD